MAKDTPRIITIQKRLKIKAVNTKVASNSPKKKYLSIIFVCICCIIPINGIDLQFNLKSYIIEFMEFAVIQTGGKQYKASKGVVLTIEKILGEYKKGDKIAFDKVLLVDNGTDTTIGTPFIDGAKVEAEITEIGRAKKVLVMKYKQKSRYLKRNGHRQPFFKVKITSIQ